MNPPPDAAVTFAFDSHLHFKEPEGRKSICSTDPFFTIYAAPPLPRGPDLPSATLPFSLKNFFQPLLHSRSADRKVLKAFLYLRVSLFYFPSRGTFSLEIES